MRSIRGSLVVLLIALGACSSDSSDDASPAPTTSAAAVPTVETPTTGGGTTIAATATAEADTTTATTDAPETTDGTATSMPAVVTEVDETTDPAATPSSAPDGTVVPIAIPPAASAGCAGFQPFPGERTVPFTAVDMAGSYILHVPPTPEQSTPLPLVLDLHGYSEPAAVQLIQSGLAARGDDLGYVTVAPSIDRPVPRWDNSLGSPDVQWIGALLDEIEGTVCIDTNRVFAAGLSNGAFMASTLACDLGDRIAAIAPVAGIQAPDGCAPARPVPVIAFHGTADTFVPFEGGLGSSVANLPSPDGSGTLGTAATSISEGPSVPERTQAWARLDGCDDQPAEQPVAADVTLLTFACPAGGAVELYRVEGGGHSWPGSAFSQQIVDIVGATTTSIDASALMWDFFQLHPLGG